MKRTVIAFSIALACLPAAKALDEAYPNPPYFDFVSLAQECHPDNPRTIPAYNYFQYFCKVYGYVVTTPQGGFGGSILAVASLGGSCSVPVIVFGDSEFTSGWQPQPSGYGGQESYIKAYAFASAGTFGTLQDWQICYPDGGCVDPGVQILTC
jgi:hypothetical protein